METWADTLTAAVAQRGFLQKKSICKSSGQRTLAKLKLNSTWGNGSQNQNKSQATREVIESFDLVTSPDTAAINLIPKR
jgi:hypothetical protein